MKTSRKIFIGIVVSVILLVYVFLNGPPFGHTIANFKLQKYIDVIYPGSNVSDVHFNFYNSDYVADILDDNGKFMQDIKYKIYDNIFFDGNLDEVVGEQFDKDMERITEAYSDNIDFTRNIHQGNHLYTTVYANGKYSTTIIDLSLRQGLDMLGVINSDVDITLEESMKKPAEITKDVIDALGENYNINSIQTIYKDINGVFEISIKDAEITYERLLENTKKSEIGYIPSK